MNYRKPKRMFEDSGTVNPEVAYYVTLDNVTNRKNQDLKAMVDLGRYFSIFAPRQSGKTTLRDLFQQYKDINKKTLYSVGLIDIRNITKLIVGGVSPFNIADQVNLPPFSLKNVRDLYAQYTEETNQPFTEGALKKIYEETSGQTWLVNRLGTILTVNIKPGTVEPIDVQDVKKAIRLLLKEKNDHFDNLYEKAKLYKETFIQVVFDHVRYKANHKEQSWLEQYGLIKEENDCAVVANNIYKARFVEAFFDEAQAYQEIPIREYELPGDRLDMKRILLNFDRYIAEIGVGAFYRKGKAYEKTGQFLLTAWLYQFVRGGGSELRYEMRSGLGRMDILLTYKEKKYIIETKMNRYNDLNGVIKEGTLQLTGKYLASERAAEGYLVVFDTKTPVGATCKTRNRQVGEKSVTSFIVGIGKSPD